MANTVIIVLPSLDTDLHGTLSPVLSLNITLPLLSVEFYDGWRMGITLPSLSLDLQLSVGNIGEMVIDLPLPIVELYGGGQIGITLPKLQFDSQLSMGTIGQLGIVLPKVVVDILSHIDEIGQLEVELPVLELNFTGQQHGFGSLAINLPSLSMLADDLPGMVGLTGIIGSIALDLPRLQVNIHGRHGNNIQCDITLPVLTVNISGIVRALTITYRGIVINTKTMAVTEYQGFNFNSMAALGNVHFAANNNGIYILRGNKQAGSMIESYLTTGLFDFGRKVKSTPRDIWLSMRADGQLILTVKSDEGLEYQYEVTGLEDTFHEERVKLGKGIKGRYYSFKLQNVRGADFDLSKISVLVDPMIQRKR
jgi:hypothetical protein